MKTDQLIDMLAQGPVEVRGRPVARRYGLALGLGLVGVLAIFVPWLGFRPDLPSAMATPPMWGKLGFLAAVFAAALLAVVRLARPGVRLGGAPLALGLPLALIWLWAAVQLGQAAPSDRADLWLGLTWRECPVRITVLSIPVFAAAFWAMRGLAPTRLRLAGAAAGLLSGATAALIYALHCPEMAAPFIGFWYVLGMLIPTVLGAVLGPRLLRW